MFQYNYKGDLLLRREAPPKVYTQFAPTLGESVTLTNNETVGAGYTQFAPTPGEITLPKGVGEYQKDLWEQSDMDTPAPTPETKGRFGSRLLKGIGRRALGLASWNDERKSTKQTAIDLSGSVMDKATSALDTVGDAAATVYDSTPVVAAQVAGAYYRSSKESVGNIAKASLAGSKIVALAAKKSGGRMWNFAKKVGKRIKSDTSAGTEFLGAAVSTTYEMTIGTAAKKAAERRETRRTDRYNDMIDRRRKYLEGVEHQLGKRITVLRNQRNNIITELYGLPSTPNNPR